MKRVLAFVICLVLITLRANSSTAQQSLSFDSLEDQYPVLVSDNLFLYSSSVLSFNIQAFLNTLPGPLKNYSEELDGQPWSAAEIIHYNAMRYGINPQLILILLEAQTELLTNPNAEIPKLPYSNPTRQEESTFHSHVAWSAEYLLSFFHKTRYDESDNLIIFSSGESFATPASANAGTYAVQATLARTLLSRATLFKQPKARINEQMSTKKRGPFGPLEIR